MHAPPLTHPLGEVKYEHTEANADDGSKEEEEEEKEEEEEDLEEEEDDDVDDDDEAQDSILSSTPTSAHLPAACGPAIARYCSSTTHTALLEGAQTKIF